MNEEIVYIDNMSSPRDILLVSQALEHLGLRVKEIEIGAAAYMNPAEVDRCSINKALTVLGFTLVDAEVKLFTEKIRSLLSAYIDNILRNQQPYSLEKYLEQELQEEYAVVVKRFQAITGQQLPDFYKRMRVERVKILLNNTHLNQKEIARRLDFKNDKSLARIFKEVSGQSIADYIQRHLLSPIQKFA